MGLGQQELQGWDQKPGAERVVLKVFRALAAVPHEERTGRSLVGAWTG